MRTRPWIGNDIVDLGEPGVAGKERDRRFMERVFTPSERARILEAAAPTLALWKTWTAKEAAFKIASKVREGLIFRHQAFELHADTPEPASRDAARPSEANALVRFEDFVIRVRWAIAAEYVHCIGQLEPNGNVAGGGSRDGFRGWRRVVADIVHDGHRLDGALSHAESASVYPSASARARLLARRLMERWDVQGAEVLRLWRSWGWSAPIVAHEGELLSEFDVSLSHDGRFVAAALAGPA